MGRIRTIKPAFYKHEDLYEAEKTSGLPLRVAFSGLWTVCDREGRFAWKPRTLKTDVLPYDDCDFSEVLEALAKFGFIVKYALEGKQFGHVPSWHEHQVINPREAKSVIPFRDASPRVNEDDNPARGEGNGREKELEEEGDASVHARILSEQVGNLSVRFQEQLTRQITVEAPKRSLTPSKTGQFMFAQWTLYNASREMLNFPVQSAAKFFESGTWGDQNLWPWIVPKNRGPSPATVGISKESPQMSDEEAEMLRQKIKVRA